MRHQSPLTVVVPAVLVLLAQACAEPPPGQSLTDDDLGLSKSSVFSSPDPVVATSAAADPGENELLGAYFSEAPPSIPHNIEGMVPITLDENLCLGCHDLRDEIGSEREPGEATPIPASHYTDLRRKPEEVGSAVTGARYVCIQCHATQTDAAPLVANTYRQ